MIEQWEWLRPLWLLGLLPLLALALWQFRRSKTESAWEQFVDPELQSYVIESTHSNRRVLVWVIIGLWGFSIVLLAGPVWQQKEVPVFQAEKAEVLVLDLSRSMNADDVPPSRLARARFKLMDLINDSEGYQTALITFAERPYVVSPLTEDIQTIASFLPSLNTDIMPVQGSRLDLAIDQAVKLLAQASIPKGHILVVSDAEIDNAALNATSSARDQGHVLSILAIGTDAGKPLRDERGQFIQNRNGSIVVPRLDSNGIQQLAAEGGGVAVVLSGGDDDIRRLRAVRDSMAVSVEDEAIKTEKLFWVEYAPWGVGLLIAFFLYFCRRGLLA